MAEQPSKVISDIWSDVSRVVRELRNVAGQPDVGDEVRQVAQEQEDSAKEVEIENEPQMLP